MAGTGKPSDRGCLRIHLIVIGVVFAIPVLCVLAFTLGIWARNREYADFTRFASVEEVHSYLLENLPLESTSTLDLHRFITEMWIYPCTSDGRPAQPLVITEDDTIRCTVLAADPYAEQMSWLDRLGNSINLWNYRIDFVVHAGKLTEIRVRRTDTSL